MGNCIEKLKVAKIRARAQELKKFGWTVVDTAGPNFGSKMSELYVVATFDERKMRSPKFSLQVMPHVEERKRLGVVLKRHNILWDVYWIRMRKQGHKRYHHNVSVYRIKK